VELQRLHEVLLSGDLDPHILADFWDALNRVRNTAWAAQQYVARKETDQASSSVLSFLVGERIRATYHLCQAISDDLKRTDIEVQAGSLVQLYEVTKVLTEQLDGVIKRLG
jgi:ABC-type transporter Mla MlaB component